MTNISAVSTRARSARSPVNESTVSTPGVDTSNFNEQHTQAGPVAKKDAGLNKEFSSKAMDFVQRRQAVIRYVQEAIAASVDRQKLNADNNGRGNSNEFKVGSLVLLATQNLAKYAVSDFGASKLAPRFIGPFTVLAKHGNTISSEPRYVGAAECPDKGRSGNCDGVRSPPPSKPLKGVKLEREPTAPDRVLHPPVVLETICAIKFARRGFSSSGTRTPVYPQMSRSDPRTAPKWQSSHAMPIGTAHGIPASTEPQCSLSILGRLEKRS
ncbi:unnamed protein product [Phytophthora fragariaefolia]|uniref:Unnamed protein product n=1 Tax=Phytophthora fragariaefolia TaxID=1490495 RepID=A0A9W7D607_9STRA|nr:unnamed protein product [Phytophthora fragariaefolia]